MIFFWSDSEPVSTWTHQVLLFLVALAEGKHTNSLLVAPRRDLARARHARWAMPFIPQPVSRSAFLWVLVIFGFESCLCHPNMTLAELILEDSVSLSVRWRK